MLHRHQTIVGWTEQSTDNKQKGSLVRGQIPPFLEYCSWNSGLNSSLPLRYPLADRTIPLKSSYRGIVFRKMRKDSRWVNPGAHAGAVQPASSWVTAPSHYPQIPCWAPCWAIIVKMRYSSCQQRLSTDFPNAAQSSFALTMYKESQIGSTFDHQICKGRSWNI